MTDTFGFTIGEAVIVYQLHWRAPEHGVVVGASADRAGRTTFHNLIIRTAAGIEMDVPISSVYHDTPAVAAFMAGIGTATPTLAARQLLWDLHHDNPHLQPNVASLPRP